MIDLTMEDDVIPARTFNASSKSNLKEDIPVANVQLAPTGKETQEVKVEISSPHHLPTKDRDTHHPSVRFASPVESQTERPTPVRNQRTDLGVFKT
jgi:hypothetical protein